MSKKKPPPSLEQLVHETERAGSSAPVVIEIFGAVGTAVRIEQLRGALAVAGGRPVELLIDSGGGNASSALAVYRLLRNHPAPVSAVIRRAHSAALLIALGADRRTIVHDGSTLLHRSRILTLGTGDDLAQAQRQIEASDMLSLEILCERTRLTRDDVFSLDSVRLNAWDSIRAGLAHGFAPGRDSPMPIRRPWPPPTAAPAQISLERASFLQTELDGLLNGSGAEAHAESIAAAAADATLAQYLPARDLPFSSESLARMTPGEFAGTLAGATEVRRRRIELLETGVFEAIRTARALAAGLAAPEYSPPAWFCGACGAPNFHSHTSDGGLRPTPCASCSHTHKETEDEDDND